MFHSMCSHPAWRNMAVTGVTSSRAGGKPPPSSLAGTTRTAPRTGGAPPPATAGRKTRGRWRDQRIRDHGDARGGDRVTDRDDGGWPPGRIGPGSGAAIIIRYASRRLLLTCTVFSVLLHILVLVLAYLFPAVAPRPEEVMVVDLADIPRSTDFLPPRRVSSRAGRPNPRAPGAQGGEAGTPAGAGPRGTRTGPPREAGPAAREVVPAATAEGEPPPEPKEPVAPGEKEGPGRQAKGKRPRPDPPGKVRPRPQARARLRRGPPARSATLTPSLGKMVMARQEPGGRGEGGPPGAPVGTGGSPPGRRGHRGGRGAASG